MIRLHDTDDWAAAQRSFESSFEALEDVSLHVVVVDPKERRVVGVSGYYVDDLEARGIYWLGWTYVNPFFRGRGYGRLVLEDVVRRVRRFGGRKLYLSTSDSEAYAGARGFYARSGFMQEGLLRDYYRQGEAKVIMGMELR